MRILIGAGLILACLPLAVILTVVLSPLWSWIEATFAIESVGHSGPAEWCYALTYLVLVTALAATLFHRRRKPH